MIFQKTVKFLSSVSFRQARTNKVHYTSALLKTKNQPNNEDLVDDVLNCDKEYQEAVDDYFQLSKAKNCLIVQPYVKWGPQKKTDISPQEQLEEAVALIKSLPNWQVENTLTVPLDTLEKKVLLKPGAFERIKDCLRSGINISAIFINLSSLKRIQVKSLQDEFGVLILDRYRVVMQILKTHAISKHAKLQVAIAELHFLQKIMSSDKIFPTSNPEYIRIMLHEREQKLKKAINQVRVQRALMRSKRKQNEYPIVAVVGYTNAGKTALIKALTGEDTLQPRNQLFATLDVTMHQGVLPYGLKVLYVDTVGFISDIPTNLIECFIATLEDAMNADVILHVEDISSSFYHYKRKHVLSTLENLARHTGTGIGTNNEVLEKIISVGNKSDLLEDETITKQSDLLLVSSKTYRGLNELTHVLQEAIIKATNRRVLSVKVPSGGDEVRWLRKNATLISEEPDEEDTQFVRARIIITHANLEKFKNTFI